MILTTSHGIPDMIATTPGGMDIKVAIGMVDIVTATIAVIAMDIVTTSIPVTKKRNENATMPPLTGRTAVNNIATILLS
jgi:hypothetical protein